jgi:hypothetical protein
MVYHLPACKGEEVMHASRIVDIPSKKIIHAHSYYNMCVPAHVSCRDSKVAKGYVVFTAVFFLYVASSWPAVASFISGLS